MAGQVAKTARVLAVFQSGVKMTEKYRPIAKKAGMGHIAAMGRFPILASVGRGIIGQATDQVNNSAPRLGVGDAHKSSVQFQAVAAAQEFDD